MKFRRTPPVTSTGRQRLRAPQEEQPKTKTFNYSASRSDAEQKLGRQVQRQAIKAAGRRASHFWFNRFGLLILLLAVVVSAANILTLSNDALIVPLTSTAHSSLLRSPAAYQATASKLLAASAWNRDKLTVNTQQLSQEMKQQFPELSSVSITIPLVAHRPIFYVQPTQAAVILQTSSNAFLIDETGKALIKAQSVAALHQASLPVIVDHSNLAIEVNHQALPANSVSFIQTVIAQLAAKQYQVSTLTLPPAADELDVQIAGQAYSIKFNMENDDAKQQAGTFLATIKQLENQHTLPAKYVDVRVDGRAYYQ